MATPRPTSSIEPTPSPEPSPTPPLPLPTPTPTPFVGAEPDERRATIDGLLELGLPLNIAHAGGDQAAPHSTLFAMAQAVEAGASVLELDVQLTGDGVLIVQHDDTVDRTTEATGPVADLTLAEIKALDNAYWFSPECWPCQDRPLEEYIYRGYLYHVLAAWFGDPWLAVAATSLSFGVSHGYQRTIGMVRATALGVLLAVPVVVTGSLFAAIAAHFWINAALGLGGWKALYPETSDATH